VDRDDFEYPDFSSLPSAFRLLPGNLLISHTSKFGVICRQIFASSVNVGFIKLSL
jgi:hypothetical protein